MSEQRTARSVRAYARGAQIAVLLQVAIAALAILVSVFLTNDIANKRSELAGLNSQAANVNAAIGEYLKALRSLDDATGGSIDTVIASFQSVDHRLSMLTPADAVAGQQRDDLRREVLRSLAAAQAQGGKYGDAIATIAALNGLHEPDPAKAAGDTLRLATYQCQNGDTGAAHTLIDNAFITQHGALLAADDAFQSACGALVAAAGSVSATADASPAPASQAPAQPSDPAFKIRYVYIQVRSEADRALGQRVAESLCDTGLARAADARYSAPGIEVIGADRPYPPRPEVRYYYAQQQGEAAAIAAIVAQTSGAQLRLRPVVGIDNLPKDRLEVWLPASDTAPEVGATTNAERRQRFSCRSAQ